MTVALFKLQFHIDSVVRYLESTHIRAHRDVKKFKKRLSYLPNNILDLEIHGYVYGSPQKLNVNNSKASFLASFDYGKHLFSAKHINKFRKVMIKGLRRGNTILFDPHVVSFCT